MGELAFVWEQEVSNRTTDEASHFMQLFDFIKLKKIGIGRDSLRKDSILGLRLGVARLLGVT